ncbi:hypothetical protein [Idiomarina sp.]|uniref:hypothetical protein n=1 Tax=Idiomarina sp. TaxID=1874361 RepID=UPI00258FD84E|nr:hypothetical protein [Idiomarina sp.]
MILVSIVKGLVEKVPKPIAKFLSKVPFRFRLGKQYSYYFRACEDKSYFEIDNQYLKRLQYIVDYAKKNSRFYSSLYHDRFENFVVNSIEDFKQLPIVTKADLQAQALETRVAEADKAFRVNTGGTSGSPLGFLLDKNAFSREWAHMHYIWMKHGYRCDDIKLTLRGKHFKSERVIKYNAVHNEYVVNASASMKSVVDVLLRHIEKESISWIHGYPSLVAEFACELATRTSQDRELVKRKLKGVLLGSEFPSSVYRRQIAANLSQNVVSWYGHSEMGVLAEEISEGVYRSLPSYGYAEAVQSEDGSGYRLVCTSYHNTAHPFIRYDTGDLVEPIRTEGSSLVFKIKEGRVGDFIIDKFGKKHSLTAVIFGRHHKAFDFVQHVQVEQKDENHIKLLVTLRDDISPSKILSLFDLSGLPFEFDVVRLSDPIRTKNGKIKLKI